jgi:DUF1365 family protein
MSYRSAIYRGDVLHERLRPKKHRLKYTVFSLLLDLDELDDLDRDIAIFGYNRWAPVSFYDADHGPTTGEALRPWAETQMREAGLAPDGGPIRLLCYPRLFGYVFNPISVFFCYRRDETLSAILYEVCNTYCERHTYVIPVADSNREAIRQSCEKSHYVSPFIAMEASYRFHILPPGERVKILIRQEDTAGPLLFASFLAKRSALCGRALAACLARFPLMTFKIAAAIHWEALRMWAKGFPVFSHNPAPAPVASSLGSSSIEKT